MKRVTMQDIANELGVTKTTVCRAFNEKSSVRPELREKILETAASRGYRPNRLAKSLSLKAGALKIGVINKAVPGYFWGLIKKGVFDAQSELADYGLKVIYLELEHGVPEPDEYERLIASFQKENIRALALYPMNYASLKNTINHLDARGIKTALFNDDLEDCRRLFYTGPHRRRIGRLSGELLGKLLRGTGNVYVYQSAGYNAVEYGERYLGFRDILAEKYPDIKIAGSLESGTGLRGLVAGKMLTREDGIYAVNLDSFVRELGLLRGGVDLRGVACVGNELPPEAVPYLKNGVIDAVIAQDAYYQGYNTVLKLFECVFENKPPERSCYDARLDIIMVENLG